MLVCDCPFFCHHQEGVTEKELLGITERAKTLRVTLVSDNGVVQIFKVEGGEAIHYATHYPGGDEIGQGNCKHLIAVRGFIGDDQARIVREAVCFEDEWEADETSLSTGVSAVG